MSRWAAFGIHLGISVLVVLGLLGAVISFWYPGILFSIDGGWSGLKLVMGVDVVLGPLLTLVVFKAGKPGLKFDLTCIALAQIACLAAGLWIVHRERPIALVFAYDTFFSLAAGDLEDHGKDPQTISNFPGRYPKLLYAELPENEISADIINLRSQFIGDPLHMQIERYRPVPEQGLDVIFRRQSAVRADFDALLGDELEGAQECLLSRFVSAYASGFVCFDAQSRRLSRFYPVQPPAP